LASSSSSSPDTVGLGERFLAFGVDALVFFIVVAPFARWLGGPGWRDFLFQTALPAAAVILCWRFFGATPGKLAVHAKVVDARTGGAPSTARLVGRYLAYFISAFPLFLGFAWIAIDRRRQGWHDKIAGTLVVYDDD
jgi:uncharacterized RDD family membrane protein YckC